MSRRLSLADRLFKWRDDLLANPRIQDLTVKLPLLRSIADQRTRSLFRLCTGFVQTQIVTACVELDVLDVLAEGPASADEIGERIGLDTLATRPRRSPWCGGGAMAATASMNSAPPCAARPA